MFGRCKLFLTSCLLRSVSGRSTNHPAFAGVMKGCKSGGAGKRGTGRNRSAVGLAA